MVKHYDPPSHNVHLAEITRLKELAETRWEIVHSEYSLRSQLQKDPNSEDFEFEKNHEELNMRHTKIHPHYCSIKKTSLSRQAYWKSIPIPYPNSLLLRHQPLGFLPRKISPLNKARFDAFRMCFPKYHISVGFPLF